MQVSYNGYATCGLFLHDMEELLSSTTPFSIMRAEGGNDVQGISAIRGSS